MTMEPKPVRVGPDPRIWDPRYGTLLEGCSCWLGTRKRWKNRSRVHRIFLWVRGSEYELALFIIRNDHGAETSPGRPHPQDLGPTLRDPVGGL